MQQISNISTPEKLKIMVIEDEEMLLQAINKKLENLNIEVISCSSGKQAVDYLSSLVELPDAVWLDYYLKDITGLEFMTELKKHPEWQNIPVIVVSNSASGEKVQHLLALGASKYLLKAEHRLDEIIGIIREMVRKKSLTN